MRDPTKMGRPSKLTPVLADEITQSIRAGASKATAARAAGIKRQTLGEWLRKGDAGEPGYADFSDAVDRAEAAYLRGISVLVTKAAVKDPKTALAILRAREPQEWNPANRMEHSGPDGAPIPVEVARAQFLRALGAAPGDPASEEPG